MSENEERNKRAQAQIEREIAEASTVRARHQALLDRMWREQRAIAEERKRLERQLNPTGLKIW